MDYFREGIDLFNEGRYGEAHEVWEALWILQPVSPRKRFLQGLIMISAALYKYERKEYSGLERLITKGLGLMKENEIEGFNMDVEKFIADAESFWNDYKSGTTGKGIVDMPKII